MEKEWQCTYEKVFEVECKSLKTSLRELKERVQRLELMMTRGVMLLVANLMGVVIVLARQLLES